MACAVPRFEQYRGFWFMCLNGDAVALSNYLTDASITST
jgi:hypothetical protein